MDKKERKQIQSNFFKREVRREGRNTIEGIEKKEGRPLSKRERHRIMVTIAKEKKKEVRRIGVSLLLGIGIGSAITGGLTPNNDYIKENDKKVVIDAQEIDEDKDIEIENVTNDREIFANGYKVNVEKTETTEQKVEKGLKRELESQKTEEDVLNYIKSFYVPEYNKSKGQNYDEYIKEENVKFHRTAELAGLKSGKAQNGDEIFVVDSEAKSYVPSSCGIMSVTINKNDKIQKESVAKSLGGKYLRVYDKDDIVEQNEDNLLLEKLGGVVDTGLKYSSHIGQEKEKNEFIKALTKYKMNEIEKYIETNEIEDNEIG